MLISVFTPSHDNRWLDECYSSLVGQTYENWEWVVLLNAGATWAPHRSDPRVRVITDATEISGVGAAKRNAVEECRGDILVELDHDDILLPQALKHVANAFEENSDAGLVYSDCAQIDDDGNPLFSPFDPTYGWRYRESTILDQRFRYPQPMAHTPHNMSYIWFLPNHLRAFTRVAYDKVGGYNPSLDILDDQDLMCRLWQYGDFIYIRKALYLQRSWRVEEEVDGEMVVKGNTQIDPEKNARLQVETVWMYDRYIEGNALAWAGRNNLLCLDLGGAHGESDARYQSVDQHPAEGVDIVHTFPSRMDLPDNSVGVIRAVDFLEHVQDKVSMMNEIHRLLAPGGMLLTMTPSTDGRGAFQDPTHVAFWNQNSFWYYTDPNLARYVPEITAKFQVSREIFTDYPSTWHRQHDISYVFANLIAIKEGGPRCGGELKWDMTASGKA